MNEEDTTLPRLFAEITGLENITDLTQPLVCVRCDRVLCAQSARFYSWAVETLGQGADSAAVLCDDCTTGLDEAISAYLGPRRVEER